jgi:hypothetical protein
METVTDTTRRSNSPDNREKRVRFNKESSPDTHEPQSPYDPAKFCVALVTCCAIDAPAFDKSYGPLLINPTFEAHSEELLKHAGLLTKVQFFTAFHKCTDSPGNVH